MYSRFPAPMIVLLAVSLLPFLAHGAILSDGSLKIRHPRTLSVSRNILASFNDGCPVGWSPCSADTCYPDDANCCSDGNFCPSGEYCVAGGGCCPDGELCSGPPPPPVTLPNNPQTPTFSTPKPTTTKPHTTSHPTEPPVTTSPQPTFSPTDTFDPEPTSSIDSGDDFPTDSPTIVTFSPIATFSSSSTTGRGDTGSLTALTDSPLATNPAALTSGAHAPMLDIWTLSVCLSSAISMAFFTS
ncbi:hypothetical protein OBBRIDRAFT_798996 [Obba rivulosa]|uniref:Uncharacterized protein n=1 Tax=Obba rivulosa TaxID=1052685 RepID=A0A8E2AJI1_9APHY|nr:hypothetical protein OBBRIDRAFT_798996 [Obba rivulosa]